MAEESSLEEIIREEDFFPLLEANIQSFVAACRGFLGRKLEEVNKRLLGQLNEEAELLESFLDDYDARNNKTFASLTELVASIRNMAGVCYMQRHILRRYFKYHLDDDVARVAHFHVESGKSYAFLVQALRDLIQETLREAREGLGLRLLDTPLPAEPLGDPLPRSHLPHDVDEEALGDVEQRIVEIASAYLQSAREILGVTVPRPASHEALRAFVTQKISEERMRTMEGRLHGLQAKYDTCIKNTQIELSDPTLPRLRGHISMGLHLFQYTTGLVHFYERHESDIRSVEAKRRIARVVDKNEVLRLIVDYGFRFAQDYVERGQVHASRLLEEYSKIERLELELPKGGALHARPVSLIVGVVQHHGTPVEMEIDGERVPANSIIQLLMVCGRNHKAKRVVFYGDEKSLRDLKALFEADFGGEGLEKLPPSLSYLREN